MVNDPNAAPQEPSRDPLEGLPPLPAVAFTVDGQQIAPADTVWHLRKREDGGGSFSLDWAKLENCTPRMIHLAKLLLASRAGQYAASTTRNEFDTLRRLSLWWAQPGLDWSQIDYDFGRAFRDHGVAKSAHAGNDFARLRDLYR
jgi:hypothetical protein